MIIILTINDLFNNINIKHNMNTRVSVKFFQSCNLLQSSTLFYRFRFCCSITSLYLLRAGTLSCRNMSLLAHEASSRALSFAIVRPAVEKTRSDGAEVAGIARYLMASLAK
jgi:hypothetical protein